MTTLTEKPPWKVEEETESPPVDLVYLVRDAFRHYEDPDAWEALHEYPFEDVCEAIRIVSDHEGRKDR